MYEQLLIMRGALTSGCCTTTQNMCGMSVVGSDYEELKRYNLAEIYDPTPPKQAQSREAST